eukprot:TRINITY_DN6931_c0_g1_i1.p1 TRINITY_DN6931_c0_g1~~TRINITY_DN6931_c0_g1_i1.p1  ORF type:complete len:172 (+),score=43.69 TRINITY_DN6931_c0_g1_i1:1-516(+)
MVEVLVNSEEYNEVKARVDQTLPSAKIVKIERVQNTWQWKHYTYMRENLPSGNPCVEKMLFHGTGQNSPALIHQGGDGFDMRHSKEGMWGRANYFAQNASYSDAYAYNGSGFKQMFLARVAVGKNHHTAPDSKIIKPPEGYDNISGETNGSVVYMMYAPYRAYPEYLITYA